MSSRKEEITIASDGLIRIDIEVDGKQITVASNALDNLEAAALRSGKGTKAASDGMNDLGSSGAKTGKDLTSASGAVDSLASASTSASKNVAGTASNLGDLGSISSSASKNLEGTNLVIGDIAGGSTVASKSITSTAGNLADLGSISSTAGSNLQNTNLAIGDIAGGSTKASEGIKGASDSLNNMGGSADKVADSTRQAAKETENVGKASGRASISIKDIAVSLGLVAVATKAFTVLKSSVDTAIARFDTLNTFPAVLQALGVSAEDSQRAMSKLSDGIDGLPTTLNDIAATAQRMYTSFNDMDEATDTAIALNNAMLGSGASAADAQRGTEQYLQVLQKGKFEMEEWKTLQETMDVGLVKVAESLGFVGKTAKSDLYEALKYGQVSVEEFNEKLIELGTGTGIMAELAKENSLGLATSIGNLKNAASRGIANIIESFNNLTKKVTGKEISQNIDGMKVIVNASFKAIGAVIEGTAPIVIAFASAVKITIPVVQALTPAIIGLAAAYATYTVITKASAAIQTANGILVIAQASTSALTIATQAQIAAIAASTTATGANAAATVAQTGAVTLSTYAIGVLTGTISLSTVAKGVATAASYALGAAWQFMLGPLGWVTAGIGLLVTGTIALIKWLNSATEEGAKLTEQTEMLASSTGSINSALEESSLAYEKHQSKIENNAEAYMQLAEKAEELATKEKLTGEEKKTLNAYIEELNRNVDGLNLAYGEQSNALSATSEQISNRINLMKEEEKLQSAQERLTEIIKEQIEVEQQLKEVNTLRAEWSQQLADGTIKMGEYKKATAELEEQEISLKEAHTAAGEERARVDQQIIESSAAVAAAAEQDTGRQMLMLDELSESQQKTVESMKSTWDDYASAATDMFDKLSDKSTVSVAKMTSNLEENQRVISKWSENIAKLAERGIDEGLLNTLREAGPESAGHVNALVKASDAELKKLSEAFANGGDVATQALVKSMGIEDSGVMGAVGHLVVGTEQALADSIKNADFKGVGGAIPEGLADGITDGTQGVEKATQDMAKATEDAAKKELEVNSPSKVFEKIGEGLPEGMVLGVNNGTKNVIQAMQKLSKSSIEQFKDMPSQFETIGKEAMTGLNRGLKANEAQVMATARNIANSAADTMRKALDIHSPSRVFESIGDDTGKGLVVGLNNQKGAVTDVVSELGVVMAEVTRKNAAEVNKIAAKSANDRGVAEAASAEKLIKINEKASADMIKKANELSKKRLEAVKMFVDEKKSLEQLSLVDEVVIWKTATESFKKGTKEKIESQKAYAKALDEVNKEITTINKKYADDMQKINDDFKKQEEDLTKKYQDTLESRMKSLYNFAGVFDEFDTKVYQSGVVLLENLRGQVKGFEDWQSTIEKLAKRAIDDGLIAELTAMGPKALGELQALNSMTDDQLSEYSALYREKQALARTQAEAELVGLKNDTEKQIGELRAIANTQLSALQTDWEKEIKAISNNTSKELTSLKKIGEDAVRGLIEGMKKMHPDLKATADSLAKTVSGTVKNSLKIKSPSRVMMELGENISEGLAIGIERKSSLVSDNIKSIAQEAHQVMRDATTAMNKEVLEIERKAAEESQRILENKYAEHDRIRDERRGADGKVRKSVGYYEALDDLHWETEGALAEVEKQKAADISKAYSGELAKRLDAVRAFFEEKKKSENLSYTDELYFWQQTGELFGEGTAERIAIQQEYQRVVDQITKEIEAINEQHATKMIEINDRLKKDTEALTAAYEKAVDDRAKSLASFAGIFDEFKVNQEKSGEDLMANLQAQVDGFKGWQESIAELSSRAINDGLLAELKALGPKALGELQALNALTDEQLAEYSALYQEKQALAREQAESELVGMKTDTEQRIEELRAAANAELDILQTEWVSKIQSVTKATDDELAGLQTIGQQAGQGLLDGLASMEGALVSKATSIANAVKSAMAGAFDIHSPSRWMRDMIGKNMMIGWINGMEAMRSKVLATADKSANWMKPNIPDVGGFVNKLRGVTIPNVNVTPFNPAIYGGQGGNVSNDNRRSFAPKIENHFTPAESTPSEVARKQEQMLRRLAMEF